jgi:RNA polymerase sigma-70 factor (ECF subfamily)
VSSLTDGYSAVANAPAAGASAAAEPSAACTKPTFEQIYETRFQDVLRWLRALGGLGADLEDLAQEVFLVVERKLDDFDGGNLNGWLFKITKNQAGHYRRRAWVRRVLSTNREPEVDDVPLHASAQLTPHQLLERREAVAFVTKTLERMSSAQRTAFVLFEIEGYSGEEIAELEQIPLNTVWTRLHHARRSFLSLLERAKRQGKMP